MLYGKKQKPEHAGNQQKAFWIKKLSIDNETTNLISKYHFGFKKNQNYF